jgi:hypothetical protein
LIIAGQFDESDSERLASRAAMLRARLN